MRPSINPREGDGEKGRWGDKEILKITDTEHACLPVGRDT